MAEGQSKSIRGGYLNPRQARDGSWYLEGALGGFVVRIYENKYKRNDKDPSHIWYLSEKPKGQPRQTQGGQGFQPRGPAVAQTTPPTQTNNFSPQQGDQGNSVMPGAWDNQDPGGDLPF